jgi:hypothetical protein
VAESTYEWTFLTGKQAVQSSTASSSTTTHAASLAVDGNADGMGSSCADTTSSKDPWWEVDLEDIVNISQVRLYNRQDGQATHLNGFSLSVDGHSCGTQAEQVPVEEEDEQILVNCTAEGQKLKVTLPGDNRILSLCEVEVHEKKLAIVGELENMGEDSLVSKAQAVRSKNADEFIQLKKSDVMKLYDEFEGVAHTLGLAKGSDHKNIDAKGSLAAELGTLAGALGLTSQNHNGSASLPKSVSLIQEDEDDESSAPPRISSKMGTSSTGSLQVSASARMLSGKTTRQTMRRH